MENVEFIEKDGLGGIEIHAIITYADGSYTSMSKAEYDRRQVEHLTEIIPADEA